MCLAVLLELRARRNWQEPLALAADSVAAARAVICRPYAYSIAGIQARRIGADEALF
jgi:hypothetical protein